MNAHKYFYTVLYRFPSTQLTQLQELNFYNNQLISLPDSIGELPKLQILNLNDNNLTLLPDSIGQLTQLQILKLNCNNLTFLPNSIRIEKYIKLYKFFL